MALKFPDGFFWGCATSSHQVEGNNRNNQWWAWEQEGGNIKDGTVSGLACDHYSRFEEDFALAEELGHNAHRFSVEWSPIEPEEGRWEGRGGRPPRPYRPREDVPRGPRGGAAQPADRPRAQHDRRPGGVGLAGVPAGRAAHGHVLERVLAERHPRRRNRAAGWRRRGGAGVVGDVGLRRAEQLLAGRGGGGAAADGHPPGAAEPGRGDEYDGLGGLPGGVLPRPGALEALREAGLHNRKRHRHRRRRAALPLHHP